MHVSHVNQLRGPQGLGPGGSYRVDENLTEIEVLNNCYSALTLISKSNNKPNKAGHFSGMTSSTTLLKPIQSRLI